MTANLLKAVFKPYASVILAMLLGWPILAADSVWKAGVAKTVITPSGGLWLAGYGGRDRPADGKIMDLWVKALALEDAGGHRAVFLTSDTLGIPQSIYRNVSAALQNKHNLQPDQFVLSASHTHCGPVLRNALLDIYPLSEGQLELIEAYSKELETKIIETAGRALSNLAPARLVAGQGATTFAVNRRANPEASVPKLLREGALKGPVDHSVPVLAVLSPDGNLQVVLFGYACHTTVMDFYKWSGDYAGFAQLAIEKSHPGATAMFFMGCGADQNPLPRRRLELAERYGNMLAAAVEEALRLPAQFVSPKLRTAMEMVSLNLGDAPTDAELEKLTTDKNAATRRWSGRLLKQLRAGDPFLRSYPFPVQAWRLGDAQLFITLGGETVVDYSLKFKSEFGPDTWVASYCNDVMAYIPSRRVLKEGGYEGGGAMIVYGLPAFRWAEDVEDLITASVRRLVEGIRK